MSHHDPSTPPGPGPDHHWARRGVRWTIVSLVISTAIALASLYVQAYQSRGGGSGSSDEAGHSSRVVDSGDTAGADGTDGGDGSSPDPGGATDPGSDPDPGADTPDSPTPADSPDDGLSPAEHELRDSLNSDQWSHDSCTHTVWEGAEAALYCTVTTVDVYGVTTAGKASVAMYGTKADRDAVFQSYAGSMQEGDCETQINVYGSWSENNTGGAAGDVLCFVSDTGRIVFLCSYYDRPALVQFTGPDQTSLTAWWHTMEPVFSD